jgi:hypothetical protein
MARIQKSPEENKDIIQLLNEVVDQLELEKGSFETLGRKLSGQEQQQVEHIKEAESHIKQAQEEIYRAFGGASRKAP